MPADLNDQSPIIREYDADSRVLCIVFSGLRRSPGEVPGFAFRRIMADLPAKRLFVRDFKKAWYLRGLHTLTRGVPDTVEFFKNEMRDIAAQRVVMVGHSLGGFAAMLYGALLGVDSVHAFSPQTFISLRQRVRNRDHRWNRYALKLPFLTPASYRDLLPWLRASKTRTQFHLHYAKDSPLDTVHALRVQSLPGVSLHAHAEGRHRLVTVLRDSGALRPLLEEAVVQPRGESGGSRR